MDQTVQNFIGFMNRAHSVYHAVSGLETMLTEAGYTRLQRQASWDLQPGGKYYLTRGDSALIAFRTSPEQLNEI